MDYDFFEVGERIAMYRKARGYSQREFAEMANIKYGTLGYIEEGVTSPTIDTLINIANALDLSLGDFLGTEGEIISFGSTCTDNEKKLLIENWKNLKRLLREYAKDERKQIQDDLIGR